MTSLARLPSWTIRPSASRTSARFGDWLPSQRKAASALVIVAATDQRLSAERIVCAFACRQNAVASIPKEIPSFVIDGRKRLQFVRTGVARAAVGQSARQAGLPGSASSNWTGAIPKRPMTAGSFASFFTPS
jgi:hypothetical protein